MDVVLLGVWEGDWLCFYRLVNLLAISAHEGRESNHHFVRENPKAPPVDHRRVPYFIDDLGGQILGRAAEGVCFLVLFKVLSEAEVGKLNVSVFAEHYIFWFEVSVNYFFSVKMSDSDCYLRHIEFRLSLREDPGFFQMEVELTTSHEVHDEEYSLGCLKNEVHVDEKRVVALHQNFLFE